MANDTQNMIPDSGIGQPGFSLSPQVYGDQSWDKRSDPYAVHTATASASAAPAAGATATDPSLTLGPDGNVYGYSRQFDNATGGYAYKYSNFGPASNLAAVSTASGIPVGMVQQAVQQQQSTLSSLQAQGAINPYVSGGMTQQQLSQALDAVRTAQQYQSTQAMQGVDPKTGMTYAQDQAGYDSQNAAFQYGSQGQAQQAALYGYQRTNDTGANYNAASGVNGMSYGQLGIANDNSQALQQYASGQNYSATNPYSGLSNGQTGLRASDAGSALSLQRDTAALSPSAYSGGQNRTAYEQGITDKQDAYNSVQSGYNLTNQAGDNQLKDLNRQYDTTAQRYNLGGASYTGGQTRQQYSQGTQDLTSQYDRTDAANKLTNQPQQQAADTYQLARQTQQAQTQSQSRNTAGLGYAGLGRPALSGWQ